MRERDMRLRVERFLQSRLRSMLMPATLGLGLAMGGCDSEGLDADDGGEPGDVAAEVAPDVASDIGPVLKYMAQMPDAGPDLQAVPIYSVAFPRDAGPELPIAQPDYMAQLPDSGMALRYMAQMPDAGRDAGEMVALYLAQLPRT